MSGRTGSVTLRLIAGAAVAAATLAATFAPLDDALRSIRPEQIRSHVWFLSHDLLAGRAPGTPGGDAAALYVASQFMRAGVRPVRDSYFQPVPIVGLTPSAERSGIEFRHQGGRVVAEYPDQAVVWPGAVDTAATLAGELVFVGYGVRAPEYDWDDYAGADVRGRVVLILVNDPPAPPEEPRLFEGRAMTYYGRWTYKLEEARRQGAAGALLVHTTDAAGYPWSVVRNSWTGEQFRLVEESGRDMAVEGWLTGELTARLLAGAGLDLDELVVQAARRDFQPVPTGIQVSAAAPAELRRIRTSNVAGIVLGSDPALRDEVVVYTSHYDHLGTASGVEGDSIFNGAYDNASGVGVLLEVAEAFAGMEPRPARSVLFLATAAEEAGLLGAEHYVRHPLVPLARTVGLINVDGANLWGETDDVIGLGIDRSTLGRVLERAAGEMGLEVRGDRAPEKGFYFRSDHFPFAREGVPAIYVEHGTAFRGRPPGWGSEVLTEYDQERYHRPGDEYDPAFDFAGAVQHAQLILRMGYAVAQQEERPRTYGSD